MALDKKLIIEIAEELNTNPSFIEKDWHATQAMKAIAAIESNDASPLFCGGTSLSKAYGLKDTIKRGGNFFKMDIEYAPVFEIPNSLRQSLQIEFSYTQPAHTAGFQDTSISSLMDGYIGNDNSFNIRSIAPVETAADKLSAMTWRVIKRDRTSDEDAPSIVRHLHDLHALKDVISTAFDQFKA